MYTVDYFIKKFKAIPESLWAVGTRQTNGKRCALGWCYPTDKEAEDSMWCTKTGSFEEKCLRTVMSPLFPDKWTGVGTINNGLHPNYQQDSAKKRILAALYDIKKMQEPTYKDITKDLAVLPEDKIEVDVKTIVNV